MKNLRKNLAIILCVFMCLSLFPVSAFAEEGEPPQEEEQITETVDHEHAYNAVITEPNCTESGYTTYTCACGENYTDGYTDPLGHTPEAVEEIPASYTEPGCTAGIRCAVCGEILEGCEGIPMPVAEVEIAVEEQRVAPPRRGNPGGNRGSAAGGSG